ncbi:MAG: hypothetical protein V2B19_33645 [Pseudomonadota bacterium]
MATVTANGVIVNCCAAILGEGYFSFNFSFEEWQWRGESSQALEISIQNLGKLSAHS